MTAPEQQAAPEQAPDGLRPLTDDEIATELSPLARTIDLILRTVPVRLGNTADLTAALTLAVAAHMGPLVGDVPEQLAELAALREQRDTYADRVDTLSAVCKSNKAAYRGAVLDCERYAAELAARDAENARLTAQVQAARAFADEMADYCSPYGVAANYAQRLIERLDTAAPLPTT